MEVQLKVLDEVKLLISVVYISDATKTLTRELKGKCWGAIVRLATPAVISVGVLDIALLEFTRFWISPGLSILAVFATLILTSIFINKVVSDDKQLIKAKIFIMEIDEKERKEKVFFFNAVYFMVSLLPVLIFGVALWISRI
ncbi:hypothetical protein GCE9029_00810 [Grimontia celer]|uniref:Uncharacterized protein n=1 Tax=Grimontia celer TaxID=1796497 RepID=A0A128EW40_9GAMM|nr:hypothetical protein [Grimontia celer]CZF78394.1 hypothetical protein GCE9029_00810 [Grimontia celer]